MLQYFHYLKVFTLGLHGPEILGMSLHLLYHLIAIKLCGEVTGSSSSSSSSSKKKLGTEIGKAAADKSRGLFSAEDWQCSKCANVNWARRQTCNMCNAPKFSDVEERTGESWNTHIL